MLRLIIHERYHTEEDRLLNYFHFLKSFPLKGILTEKKNQVNEFKNRLTVSLLNRINSKREILISAKNTLILVSPEMTLRRGYTIVRDRYGRVIDGIYRIKENMNLDIEFKDGYADCIVKNVNEKDGKI